MNDKVWSKAEPLTSEQEALVHKSITDIFDSTSLQELQEGKPLSALGLDSLDMAELAMSLEDDLGIEVDDDLLTKVETLDDLKKLVSYFLSQN